MSETNNTKQAFWLAIGSLASFGFGIISSMILSRYFPKADYGTYKQVLYVYHTLLTVFTLGLPRSFSYFLPRVPKDQAKSLIAKLTRLFLLLGFVFSALLFVFSGLMADILNNPDLKDAIRIFAIVPALLMPTMGLEGILATYQKTKFMAVYTIGTRIIMLCCVALPVMFFNLGYRQAIFGFVIGSAITCVIAFWLKYYPVRNFGKCECDISYREIFKFSLPLLYASLWGIVIGSADQFFVSRYFGNVVFAEFSNGNMELPFVGMIVSACAAVLSPIISKMSYEKANPITEVLPLWMSVFKKTTMLIYPLVIYCMVFADVIMVAMYGSQYSVSSGYFRIKLIANFFTVISYGPLVINIGKVKYYSNVHMLTALVIVVLEFASVHLISTPYAISWISTMCHLGKIFAMLYLVASFFGIKIYKLFPWKTINLILFPSIIILIGIRYCVVNYYHMDSWFAVTVSFTSYLLIFFLYSLIVKIDYVSIVKPLIKK